MVRIGGQQDIQNGENFSTEFEAEEAGVFVSHPEFDPLREEILRKRIADFREFFGLDRDGSYKDFVRDRQDKREVNFQRYVTNIESEGISRKRVSCVEQRKMQIEERKMDFDSTFQEMNVLQRQVKKMQRRSVIRRLKKNGIRDAQKLIEGLEEMGSKFLLRPTGRGDQREYEIDYKGFLLPSFIRAVEEVGDVDIFLEGLRRNDLLGKEIYLFSYSENKDEEDDGKVDAIKRLGKIDNERFEKVLGQFGSITFQNFVCEEGNYYKLRLDDSYIDVFERGLNATQIEALEIAERMSKLVGYQNNYGIKIVNCLTDPEGVINRLKVLENGIGFERGRYKFDKTDVKTRYWGVGEEENEALVNLFSEGCEVSISFLDQSGEESIKKNAIEKVVEILASEKAPYIKVVMEYLEVNDIESIIKISENIDELVELFDVVSAIKRRIPDSVVSVDFKKLPNPLIVNSGRICGYFLEQIKDMVEKVANNYGELGECFEDCPIMGAKALMKKGRYRIGSGWSKEMISDEMLERLPENARKAFILLLKSDNDVMSVFYLEFIDEFDEYFNEDGSVKAKFLEANYYRIENNIDDYLNPDVLEEMEEEDKQIWSFVYKSRELYSSSIITFIIRNSRRFSNLIVDGVPSLEFIEELANHGSYNDALKSILTLQFLEAIEDVDERSFWQYYAETGNTNVRQLLVKNKSKFSELVIDGSETILFVELVVGKDVNAAAMMLSDQMIEGIENEDDKRFWKCFYSFSNAEVVRNLLFENRERFDDLVDEDGIANVQMVEMIASRNIDLVVGIITDEMLGRMDEADRNFWSKFVTIGDNLLRKLVYKDRVDYKLDETGNFELFLKVWDRINNSQSLELRRLKDEIIELIFTRESFEECLNILNRVEEIFIRNNLPVVWKTFRVFDLLVNEINLENKLNIGNISPVLRSTGDIERRAIIFADLLKIHIDSGNRSLRDFVDVFVEGEPLLAKYESGGRDLDVMSDDERRKLISFLNKADTLFDSIYYDKQEGKPMRRESWRNISINERIDNLKTSLGINVSQDTFVTISQRLNQVFLRPLGIETMTQLRERMRRSIERADRRGRDIYQQAREDNGDKYLDLEEGDLIKGVEEEYFGNIIQNGSVAKEFLGSSSGSDDTPLDTDLTIVKSQDGESGPEEYGGITFTNILSNSYAGLTKGYGSLRLILKGGNTDRFCLTRGAIAEEEKIDFVLGGGSLRGGRVINSLGEFATDKYELFHSLAGEGGKHMGIRTGFAFTEVDYIVATQLLYTKEGFVTKDLRNIYFEIAKNGHYIPITDIYGKVIFTPDDFDELRKSFDGIKYYESNELKINLGSERSSYLDDIEGLKPVLKQDRERIERLSEVIKDRIQTEIPRFRVSDKVGESRNLFMREDESTGILGVELFNTGSTGRSTNIVGESDFDLSLSLDYVDFRDVDKRSLAETLARNFDVVKEGTWYERADGSCQLHAIRVVIDGEEVEIDIGIVNKNRVDVFATHNALSNRYDYIRYQYGEEAHDQVLANVVLAKKILKFGECYKKGISGQGGLGGVGVENWILTNQGNFEQACLSFLKASFIDGNWESGEMRSFEDIKGKYEIWDPGLNLLNMSHDEFVANNMSESGYQKMIEVLKDYVSGRIKMNEEGKIVRI